MAIDRKIKLKDSEWEIIEQLMQVNTNPPSKIERSKELIGLEFTIDAVTQVIQLSPKLYKLTSIALASNTNLALKRGNFCCYVDRKSLQRVLHILT